MIRIEKAFATVSGKWLNPKNPLAAMLFLRCHGAFKTAAGLAMAGQTVEAHVLNRTILEFAAYALHISRHPKLGEVWLNRHQGAPQFAESRAAFLHRKVEATIKSVNRHAGERFEKLYQWSIDWGGHPNERAVTGNMQMLKETDRMTMIAVLQHGDGLALDSILKTTAQCGVCSLEILQGVFNSLFEILGINAEILKLGKGL